MPWNGSWPEGELWRRLRPEARRMRIQPTPAEQRMWVLVRDGRLDGFKFRQQMWLCGFIADFACVEARLVIEADGGQHGSNEEYDRQRSAAFAKEGFRTLRFWNNEILGNVDGVLLAIQEALSPHPAITSLQGPPSPLRGEDKGNTQPSPLPSGEREGPARHSRVGG